MLISTQGNKMYVDGRDKAIVPFLLTDGVWEEYVTHLFTKTVKSHHIVMDIGANIGYYSLIAAKQVGMKGRVYSFEPEPNNFKLLRKNAEVNGYTNIVPIQKAVSNKKGKLKLFLNKSNLGAHSISEGNVPTHKGGAVEVETISLDDFFEKEVKEGHVDFIKIDVEGAEGLVMEGAEKVLKSEKLKMLMEFWPHGLKNTGTDPLKLLEKLQSYGFNIKLIDEKNQVVKHAEAEEIIKYCDGTKNGMGEVNLFLEK
jgi:FkbM family methyltransferase